MARTNKRKYDVVLYGATGFTGKLVADYLAKAYGATGDLKWALGGRSEAKLEAVRADLVKRWPDAATLPLVVADSRDPASLTAMAKLAKVVCTTVGPYAKYGSELVAACAAEGTDTCDLTGETQWVRRMVDEHHAVAAASGARIVNCCGFDSIPSDLGTLVLQEHAIAQHGQPVKDVTLYVWKMKGTASGGTIDTARTTIAAVKQDPSLRKILGNPYACNPEGERSGPDGGDLNWAKFDPAIGRWVGPFVMASTNTRIVRRSNALLGYRYGKDFRYREVTRFSKGLRGRLEAMAMAGALGGLLVGLATPLTRPILDRLLPDPGEGPSPETIEAGFFDMRIKGSIGGKDLTVKVRGERDPGYGATAIMLGEAAVCLAKDRTALPKAAGVLTPATGMGMVLVERLRAAGMTFEVM
ncbi:MAG: short subunit dehydrogenase-like uncharacterized protein [Myxococcota bacterium]|jgi:short subunit dehydrogenase-like uncharacterized protein